MLCESAALENDNVSQVSREEIKKITAVPIASPSFIGPESAQLFNQLACHTFIKDLVIHR